MNEDSLRDMTVNNLHDCCIMKRDWGSKNVQIWDKQSSEILAIHMDVCLVCVDDEFVEFASLYLGERVTDCNVSF